MADKRVVLVSNGLDGPTVLYDDGSYQHLPIDWGEPPPPLTGDVNFETRRGGFEVWYSNRIASEHGDLVEASALWLLDQPGIERVSIEGPEVLLVDGPFDEGLRNGLKAWWSARVEDFALSGVRIGVDRTFSSRCLTTT